jgi:hypothetical protein
MEWDILNELKKMLNNPELSPSEKARIANGIAYHASVLNKLLSQKEEDTEPKETTLGDFISQINSKRMRRLVRREYRSWQRRLSCRR